MDNKTSADKINKYKKNKKATIICTVTVIVLAVILSLLYMIDYDAIAERWFGNKNEAVTEDLFFYEPDFKTNILEDQEYLELNRMLSYSNGPETFVITKDNYEDYGVCCVLFGKYFNALINGDSDTYNSLFTSDYIEENGLQSNFPMQRVYNMSVTLESENNYSEGEYKGYTQYRFEVLYSILENDGTVRRDISSEGTKPLHFEILYSEQTGAKINKIISENYINKTTK